MVASFKVGSASLLLFGTATLALSLAASSSPSAESVPSKADAAIDVSFVTSDRCMACHNGITTGDGSSLSFGLDWQTTMMANSARDPYWHAAVRREVLDHPESKAAIENECSRCHMPMTNEAEREAGNLGSVFDHLPIAGGALGDPAHDGVSCSVCHRIEPDTLGTEQSFTGGFVIDHDQSEGQHAIYGPFDVALGLQQLMQSASNHVPVASDHVRSSEMCATCHTLITHSLGPGGEVLGEFPEQVPYLEWLHSDFREESSCQSCHMPLVEEAPISSVLPQPREGVRRHVFRGGNFFMQKLLGRFRGDLGVAASADRLEAASEKTKEHLAEASARLEFESAAVEGSVLSLELDIENLAGHKLPTAYPSRRVWLHLRVLDEAGRVVFESGTLSPDGSIKGNDNDLDGSRYEPHYQTISSPDQVQIYETILAQPDGRLTTGLLQATQYRKDNRILPRGFDKKTAEPRIAVHGRALEDADFEGGRERVTFEIDLGSRRGPYRVEAALLYQPISYRWAQNLRDYDAPEPQRFVGYYEAMSADSAALLSRATVEVE